MGSDAPVVSIIDFGMGNLYSVKNACRYVGLNAVITSNKQNILDADGIILPGVGAFGDAMLNLKKLDLINPIKEFINTGKPFMGICLGMQLLLTESEEFGIHNGLDVIEGSVVKFSHGSRTVKKIKVPQVGWNKLIKVENAQNDRWNNSSLNGLASGVFMYFVHSYYPIPRIKQITLSYTCYQDINYCSSLQWRNVFACQFHPEKSARQGLRIYQNWAELIKSKKVRTDCD